MHRFTRPALCAFVLISLSTSPAPAIELGEPVGPVSVIGIDGKPIAIANYKDQAATAILFLSSRSEAVAEVINDVNRLYRKHRRLGVNYVGVCPQEGETADELLAFAQNRGLIFTIYGDPRQELARRLGLKTIPSVVLIDSAGKLLHRGGLNTQGERLAFDVAIANKITPVEESRERRAPTPIGKAGPPRKIESAYGTPAFSAELIFEKAPGAVVHHCSTIAQTPKGDLLCLWYGGSYESADDQVLFLSRRKKGARDWQQPQVLIRDPVRPPGNAVIFADGLGQLRIIWGRMESARPIRRGEGWDACRMMIRTSKDDGLTWSADEEFLSKDIRGVPRNPPARRANGELILAVEDFLGEVEGSRFLIGNAGGASWKAGGFTPAGSQPAVIERRDGSLFALLRGAPRLMQVESQDGGETWSEGKASTLRNPDAGIAMAQLKNGHLILVYNDSDTLRTPLSMARSTDEGRTWETPLHLESNPGEYSYPCVIEANDGRIHVSYTFRRFSIKHVELNEDWLVSLERPN